MFPGEKNWRYLLPCSIICVGSSDTEPCVSSLFIVAYDRFEGSVKVIDNTNDQSMNSSILGNKCNFSMLNT